MRSAATALTRSSRSLLACAVTGGLLGQAVLAISATHHGSAYGLVTALVFLLASSAALACLLCHLHAASPRMKRAGAERTSRSTPPMQRWLLTLGLAALASLQAGPLLAG